jgi:uncharacterized protein (DUF2336 family)
MAQDAMRFHRLIDLANEASSEKRRELLREVTDLFLADAPGYSANEREHFDVIMRSVARDMEDAVRRELAQRLADLPSAPEGLIRQLANDDFRVAEEVLRKSPVLCETDLVAIIQAKGQEEMAAIATRKDVTAVVSDALVERGDDTVLVKLVSNESAKFSNGGFQKIVERSEQNEALQKPLIARADLPVALMQDMFTFVSSELRAKITQKLDALPPGVLDKALAEAGRAFTVDPPVLKDAERKAMVRIAELARRRELTEGVLLEFVRTKQTAEFKHALARLAEVDLKTIERILRARNTEAVALICKATKLSRATFAAIAGSMGAAPGGKADAILALYDQVTTSAAQRAMRFWQVRKAAADGVAA